MSPSYRTRVRIVWLLLAIIFAIATVLTLEAADDSTAPTTTPVITEDDPLWDCTTMGNRICGGGNNR